MRSLSPSLFAQLIAPQLIAGALVCGDLVPVNLPCRWRFQRLVRSAHPMYEMVHELRA